MRNSVRRKVSMLAWLLVAEIGTHAVGADPLPSWNDGSAKQAIVAFVEKVTNESGPDFVPLAKRIATFDNDGTLWCEQPMYFQMIFAFDRIKAIAEEQPERKNTEPYKTVLAGELMKFGASGQKGLLEIMAATHSGMTVEEFHAVVSDWMRTARHPRFHRPYDQCIYQPMHDLLQYLRANGFKTFIVSGGGIEFMRPWVEKVYGIPPEQVVGSSGVVKFELRNGTPVLMKEPKVEFIDDGPGKPVGINRFMGRRPIAAFGNSIGDQQMLEYTGAGDGARLMMLVLHDDAKREYAYGPANGLPDSKIGTFTQALYDEAKSKRWTVISMKEDWKQIFGFEK